MPKLVFQVVSSVGGGVEHLYSMGIGVWEPKIIAVGVAGLEVGGGEPRGTVLKPKLFKGH
jgi:hypothetical protein